MINLPDAGAAWYNHPNDFPPNLAGVIIRSIEDSFLTSICVYSRDEMHGDFDSSIPGGSTLIYAVWTNDGAILTLNRGFEHYLGYLISEKPKIVKRNIRHAVNFAIEDIQERSDNNIYIQLHEPGVEESFIEEDELELPEEVTFDRGNIQKIVQFDESV